MVDAFFAAAGSGDLSALLALLAPDAELRAFKPEGVTVVQGAAKIAAQTSAARAGAAAGAVLRPITVRGAAGVLILVDDRPVMIMAFTVRDGARHQDQLGHRPKPARADRPLLGGMNVRRVDIHASGK